jgi:PGF-CTERM protein
VKWSSPTVVDGTVYVGSHDHSVYALDAATGDKQWQFEANDRVRSPPMVADGTVFVGSHDQHLYALDAATGDKQWQFETRGGAVKTSPTVADGMVFVGSDNNSIYALDAETGEQRWQFEADGRMKSPTVTDGTVFVGSHDQHLYALDAATGDKRWQFETSGKLKSSPTVADGTVFVGSDDHNVYALNAETGEAHWQFETGGVIHASSPTVADGTVFVGSDDGHVYALNAETGETHWRFETGGPVHSSPTVVDSLVIVGSSDNSIYALDADAGEQQWQFETGGKVKSSPTVVSGTVFVGSWDKNVYALDAGVPGSSRGSRVNLGTLGHHHIWAQRASDAPQNPRFTITDTDPAGDIERQPGERMNVAVTVENTGIADGTDVVTFSPATDAWDVETAVSTGPAPFDAENSCPVCNMNPDGDTYEAWHGQAIHADGTRVEACSTGCLVEYVTYPDFYGQSESAIESVWAVDFEDIYEEDGEWTRDGDHQDLIDLREGYLVLTPSARSYYGMPMSDGSPLAFASRNDAEAWIEENDIEYYETVSEDDIVTLDELEPAVVDYRQRRRKHFGVDASAGTGTDGETERLDVTVGYWGESDTATESVTVTIGNTTKTDESLTLERGETWEKSYEVDSDDLPMVWSVETDARTVDGTLGGRDCSGSGVSPNKPVELAVAESTTVTLAVDAPSAEGEYDWTVTTSDDQSQTYTLSVITEDEEDTTADGEGEEDTTADGSENEEQADDQSEDSEDTSEQPDDEDTGESAPGFGIGSALTGLGGAAYLLKRRLTDTETESPRNS